MENMPNSLIKLVEEGILDGKDKPSTTVLDHQIHKMNARLIADKIADLSEKDAKLLHELMLTVNILSQIFKKINILHLRQIFYTLHIWSLLILVSKLERRTLKKNMRNSNSKPKKKFTLPYFHFLQ